MYAIFITICALVVLLGFEIRHREMVEELAKLKASTSRLDEEVIALKSQMKLKKDAYEEHKPLLERD